MRVKKETVATLSPYTLELIARALRQYRGAGEQNAEPLAALIDRADGGKLTRRIACK